MNLPDQVRPYYSRHLFNSEMKRRGYDTLIVVYDTYKNANGDIEADVVRARFLNDSRFHHEDREAHRQGFSGAEADIAQVKELLRQSGFEQDRIQ